MQNFFEVPVGWPWLSRPGRAVLIACVGLLAACDARQLTAPGARNPSSLRGYGLIEPISSVLVPPPLNSSPGAVAGAPSVQVGSAPDSSWVVLTVTGEIQQRRNPDCEYAPGYWPCQEGAVTVPFGAQPWDGGPVRIWAQQSVGGGWMKLRGVGGANSTAAIGLHYQDTAGSLYGQVNAQPRWAWNPNTGEGPFSYYLTGGYTVTATVVPSPIGIVESGPMDSAGTQQFTVLPLYELQFSNPLEWTWSWPAGAVTWEFFPGESVSEKPGSVGRFYRVPECEFKLICTYTPPEPGRMQVSAYVEGQYASVRSGEWTNACASDGGGGGLSLDLVAACTDTDGPQLRVTCQPSGPVRGDTVSCRSWVTPAQPFTITRREATGPGGLSVIDSIPRSYSPGEVDAWSGPAIVKTRVTAYATIPGQANPLRGRAEFDPTPRPWPAYNITNPRVDTVVDAGLMTWTPTVTNTTIGGTYLYPLAIRNTPVFRASTGPNAGLAMLGAQPVFQDPHIAHIYLHPAIFTPAADTAWARWNNDQNGTPSGTCPQSKMSQVQIEDARHEGVTVATSSHVGVANREFRSGKPQLKMEEFYMQATAPDSVVQFGALAAYTDWYMHSYWSAQTAFDLNDRPRIWDVILACHLDYDPTNP